MDMPNQRHLDPDIKEQSTEMLHMKANRKNVTESFNSCDREVSHTEGSSQPVH